MNDFIILLIEYFRHYHLWFLGALMILQNNGVPLGSSLVVMATGALASYGEFNLPVLWLAVWVFSLLGDILSYQLWKYVGKKVVPRSARVAGFIGPALLKAENNFNRFGKGVVVFTRFPLSALGTVINMSAGATGFRLSKFIVAVAIGQLLWSSFYLGLGYWFGDAWEQIALLVSQFGRLMLLISALVLAAYLAWRILKSRK